MKKYIARDATIAITYKCNSRCQMCNIWQIENPEELPIEAFKNLSADLRYINLSGGEPFLRGDLLDIVKAVNESAPKAKIIISSNGLATELIKKRMTEIAKIDTRVGVRISLDGLGIMHDEIRGIPGMYDAVMNTMYELKKIGIKNLGFSFTVMDKNVHHLKDVYKLSKTMGVELALAVVQNSEIYFQIADNKMTFIDELERNLNFVIDSELATWNPKRWGELFTTTVYFFMPRKINGYFQRAGFDSLFIDPTGNIFPSNLINLKIGNLKDENLNSIWESNQANQVRQEIKEKGITESWIICTIRGEMKKHIVKAGLWAIRNKIRVMIR